MSAANNETSSPSGIGQFLKRIRSRSKSPAANQRVISTTSTLSTTPSPPQQKASCIRSESSKSPAAHSPFGNLMARLSGRRRRTANAAQPLLEQQTSRTAVSEEDLVSKSLASDIEKGLSPLVDTNHHRIMPTTAASISSTSHNFSYSQETLLIETPRRLPSYIGVSCALSGYRRRPFIRSLASTPNHQQQHRFAPGLVEYRMQQLNASSSTSTTTSPKLIEYDEPTITPAAVRQLVVDFDRMQIDSTTKRRPVGAPPPVPPIRRSILSPIVSDATGSNSSSAPTVSCVTGKTLFS